LVYTKRLIGKEITIAESLDETLKGMTGAIVDETKNTMLLDKAGRIIRVPKQVVTIKLKRPNSNEYETVSGQDIIGTPQERIYKY
jgi:ribonuclease P protein subunit POP4